MLTSHPDEIEIKEAVFGLSADSSAGLEGYY